MHCVAEKKAAVNTIFRLRLIFAILVLAIGTAAADTIIDKELTVPRGDFKEVHYLIPDGAEDSIIQVSFTCKGGFYDDVTFFVFTKEQYVRWYSYYSHKPIFKLAKKKEGKFEFPVVSGETYYFVFDNFFSTVSNKQVKVQVKLIGLTEGLKDQKGNSRKQNTRSR